MNIYDKRCMAFAMLAFFVANCITETRGQTCIHLEETNDKCRSEGFIKLGEPIDHVVNKGAPTSIFTIPTYLRSLYWWCGHYNRERVGWGASANRLRVTFTGNGNIKWEFEHCY